MIENAQALWKIKLKMFCQEAAVEKWTTQYTLNEWLCVLDFYLKSDSHLPKKNFLFDSMIVLQKWWKMFFISS